MHRVLAGRCASSSKFSEADGGSSAHECHPRPGKGDPGGRVAFWFIREKVVGAK